MSLTGIGLRAAVGVALLFGATAGCGGSASSPSSSGGQSGGGGGAPTSTSCRTGVATYRIVTTSPGNFTSTTNGSCTFNPTTVEGTCTNQYTDTLGSSFTSVSTTRNSSRGEVVDEVSVIPPLTLSSSTTTTVSGPSLPASTGTSTRTFSGRRLLTMTSVSQPSGQTSTTTYTAWDSSDRPTAGSQVSAGQTSAAAFSYDSATRTQTMTQSGVTCTQTFDQNGNPAVGVCGGSTATTTVLTTQQICR